MWLLWLLCSHGLLWLLLLLLLLLHGSAVSLLCHAPWLLLLLLSLLLLHSHLLHLLHVHYKQKDDDIHEYTSIYSCKVVQKKNKSFTCGGLNRLKLKSNL